MNHLFVIKDVSNTDARMLFSTFILAKQVSVLLD